MLLSTFAPILALPGGHDDHYTPFYLLASGLNLALLLWLGWRRGYPLRSWLLLLACVSLAFIVGTKAIALSGDEWRTLLSTGQWPLQGARSVLGGALAGGLALVALRRVFGFGREVLDAFALPLCVALAVQCVGCVLTGCCFGEATADGWGLRYGPGTWPYAVQAARGLLPAGATYSLPVHPTQLYTLLLCAGVGALLVLTRHRPWPAGSRWWLHLGLLLAGRGLLESWRDPSGEPVGGAARTLAGITLLEVQWALLVAAPLALGVWGWQVWRRHPVAPATAPAPAAPVRNLLSLAALLLLTAGLGPGALVLPEVLVIKGLLLTVLLLESAAWVRQTVRLGRLGRATLPLGLASTVLVLTSQTPADSTRSSLEITVGAGNGAYFEDVQDGGGCSGPVTRTTYDHRYAVRGGTVELHRENNHRTTFGVGVWGGRDKVAYQLLDPPTGAVIATTDSSLALFSVNPYVEFTSALRPGKIGFGYRTGLHLGRLHHQGQKSDLWADAKSGGVSLDLGVWAGVREKLYLQADVNRGSLGVGNPTARLGLGSGLGQLDGRHVLLGMAFAENESSSGMGFVSADLRLGRSGLTLYPYAATNFSGMHQLNLRVGYRIPLRKAGPPR